MTKRPLPLAAAAALDIIVSSGSREMHANDFSLHMLQRGFGSRLAVEALRAFERRGWLVRADSVIKITEEGFGARPVVTRKTPLPRRRHARLPRGLFAE
jgi:hypothetical protein